ncbi:DUF4199 domain-containing protein [Luteibaculum oceani]|uniref:DUF4199 domain-containing protein n=1 Tax=Luteibaculum oceani TaxID=1294296 RepID=A0A5C6UYR1_9FLAO|nr:DUF4199 domain-containing protein [Luteibaculum oceani]TXC78623.1 DUF4199 domain-containing protein [Luteibaculum oceani]
MDKLAVELKWSAIALILELITGHLSIRYITPETAVFDVGNPLIIGVLAICLYLGILFKKQKYFGGRISFSKAFRTGIIIGFLVAFMQPMLYWIIAMVYANPPQLGNAGSIIGILLLHILLSPLIAFILKRNKPSEEF